MLGYLLEAPLRGASNKYPQHMFPAEIMKNINQLSNYCSKMCQAACIIPVGCLA